MVWCLVKREGTSKSMEKMWLQHTLFTHLLLRWSDMRHKKFIPLQPLINTKPRTFKCYLRQLINFSRHLSVCHSLMHIHCKTL